MRELRHSIAEELYGIIESPDILLVLEKKCREIEDIGFGRIHLSGPMIFSRGIQICSTLVVDLRKQSVQLCAFVLCKHVFDLPLCDVEIPGMHLDKCKIVAS